MKLDVKRTRDALQNFDFPRLFIEELGWSQPRNRRPISFQVDELNYQRREIAQLGGVTVFEVEAQAGSIPDSQTRKAVHKDISSVVHENLLIFVDKPRTQSMWYWVKREKGKPLSREHLYVKGQPGDLFLSKLDAMAVDFKDIANNLTVTQVADRLRQALDVERVTKKFYGEFKNTYTQFLEYILGISDERDRRWYASVLLNRLMFIYFLQRKRFIDNGNLNYLQDKLTQSQQQGADHYYSVFLNTLFFEGFAKPEAERSQEARQLLGKIVYLNGGLFLQHPVEARYPSIKISDVAFQNLFDLFGRYSWNLDDTPGGQDDEINPDVLGYIFEKYINQKEFGAYYTRPEITEYLCRQTIHNLILERINQPSIADTSLKGRHFNNVPELLLKLDASLCRELLLEVLPKLTLLDPACGSGAFLVAAMKTLIEIYSAVTGRIEFLNDGNLKAELDRLKKAHHSLNYYIKKKIITENLFGVDIMEEATEIARLRLFLALVASARSMDELEPLPNIDFNVLPGNSLVGLLQVHQTQYQGRIGEKPYHELVLEKNRLIQLYRQTSLDAGQEGQTYATDYSAGLQKLRDEIQRFRTQAAANLNNILRDQFKNLGIKYERSNWAGTNDAEGKSNKREREVIPEDIERLHPFHWGFEFDQVMNERGGFDAIITNPPWEIFKPQAKEFFQRYSELVTKKKMTIKEFEEEQGKLLKDTEIRAAWLEYLSGFPYVNLFFRLAPQYNNQASKVSGKIFNIDINLYKLFLEQCYNLLRDGGQCGIVIPSGIYTDLGTKQLRELLFGKTHITGLFGFENRKEIFEGVHRSFKFAVLTFAKGGETKEFPAAFMRLDVAELDNFPAFDSLHIEVALIRKLSPDSLSIMEFKSDLDVTIARKMLKFPLLGENIPGKWNLTLGREFHMTDDKALFQTQPEKTRLPLYEGKMIHQFTHEWGKPKYWIEEKEGRKALLGKEPESKQKLNYQYFRLAYRAIASNTNERTLIVTVLPKNVFLGHSLNANRNKISESELLAITTLLNSFVVDYSLRQRVSSNLTVFYIQQLPIPRLSEGNPEFRPIVERAARLVCTTAEFKELWEAVMPGQPWSIGVAATNEVERGKLRAELDGLVAHLYGLTEAEFAHILGTFPLVPEPVKVATQNAYRDFAPKTEDELLLQLIRQGENDRVEFKRIATANKDKIVQGIAAFMNSSEGGTFLIGVEDDGTITGVESDYAAANPGKPNADSYQMFLQQAINSGLADDFATCYKLTMHVLAGRTICQIKIKPAPEPVYLKSGDFYRRNGNQKEKLSPKATQEYIKQRWG